MYSRGKSQVGKRRKTVIKEEKAVHSRGKSQVGERRKPDTVVS